MTDGQRVTMGLFWRGILALAVFVAVVGVLLFLPAGDIRWAKGWLFLLVLLLLTAASSVYLWRTNPDIFVARSRIHPGTKAWDKVLMAFLLSSFAAIFLAAGLDGGRFHWSNVPLAVIVLGYVLLCVGFLISIWVYRVNKFAEPSVRIQTERGHKVIDTGPYAIIRHPLYLGGLLMFTGIPLALGSCWALIPTAVGTLVIIVRIVLEERTLQAELEGYKKYAARVRYRLIPGVW
ncbi:MAG: isoprenylcysteine carboxylmethyltransferase family protein [Planctomycetes bacterium]|nr:isoprenylcysteine carboxylmethyltransferase family protein [Planctomycetota bacterium]